MKYEGIEDSCPVTEDNMDEECLRVATIYFRDALIAIGRHSIKANEKHNGKDAPIEWTRDISNDHWGSWGRHLSNLGTIDEDSGSQHHIPWLWRTLAIVQIFIENKD